MVRSAGNRDSRVIFGVDQGSDCGCQSHDPCGLWGNGETTEEVLPRAPRIKTARAGKVIQPQSSNVRSFVPLLQGVGPVVKISNKGGHPHTRSARPAARARPGISGSTTNTSAGARRRLSSRSDARCSPPSRPVSSYAIVRLGRRGIVPKPRPASSDTRSSGTSVPAWLSQLALIFSRVIFSGTSKDFAASPLAVLCEGASGGSGRREGGGGARLKLARAVRF